MGLRAGMLEGMNGEKRSYYFRRQVGRGVGAAAERTVYDDHPVSQDLTLVYCVLIMKNTLLV